VLQVRQMGPDGKAHGSEAYVFGNEVGERATNPMSCLSRGVAEGDTGETGRRVVGGAD
jgi:hypothetical protein